MGGGGETNRNLLDNWDFTKPVNQRGKSSYGPYSASNVRNYVTIDRFLCENGTVTINNSYVSISSTSSVSVNEPMVFIQFIDPDYINFIKGRQVTFSIMINNVIHSMTDIMPNSTSGIHDGLRIEIPANNNSSKIFHMNLYGDLTSNNNRMLRIFTINPSATLNIQALKLELGNESTLNHDLLGSSYLEEVRKCQKYFESSNYQVCYGLGTSAYTIEHTTSYFMKQEKRIDACIFSVNPSPSQKLEVYEMDTENDVKTLPVDGCVLQVPTTYNRYCYSPLIYNSSGKIVVGKKYLIRVGDNAYHISAEL